MGAWVDESLSMTRRPKPSCITRVYSLNVYTQWHFSSYNNHYCWSVWIKILAYEYSLLLTCSVRSVFTSDWRELAIDRAFRGKRDLYSSAINPHRSDKIRFTSTQRTLFSTSRRHPRWSHLDDFVDRHSVRVCYRNWSKLLLLELTNDNVHKLLVFRRRYSLLYREFVTKTWSPHAEKNQTNVFVVFVIHYVDCRRLYSLNRQSTVFTDRSAN